jgi:TRAP-type C4-dicarboxylate transport system permease large subunit
MIMVIVASSNMFGELLAFTGSTNKLVAYITGVTTEPYTLLFLIMLVVFVLCMFIDQVAIMLIIVPIVKPLLDVVGLDPIWFWTLILINLTLGGITPPFGYTMFAFKGGAPDVPLSEIFAATWPFVGLFVVVLLLVVAVPELATFLPSLL